MQSERAMEPARKKILIMDDDEPTARLLARFMRDYEVAVASDGAAGLARAIEFRPDLVITDMWMPKLDGIEMTRALKDDPVLRHVPVIVLTAITDGPHVAACIAAGAQNFLAKPVAIDQLLRIVRRKLGPGTAPT